MNTEDLLEELCDFGRIIQNWDGEDIHKMYDWMIGVNLVAQSLNDDTLFTSIINPHDLPVGSSPIPENLKNVWTWDNHSRYIVGTRWTADHLKIRKLDELYIE